MIQVPDDLWAEILEFIEGQVDVVDGSYGEPHPNSAMSLVQRIEEAGLLPKSQVGTTTFEAITDIPGVVGLRVKNT